MIKSVHFSNFKALRDTTLPLSRFTLIVGPNGSGKSTAMQALSMFYNPNINDFGKLISVDLQFVENETIAVTVDWALDERTSARAKEGAESLAISLPSELSVKFTTKWERRAGKFDCEGPKQQDNEAALTPELEREIFAKLKSFRIFSFDAEAMSQPSTVRRGIELAPNGSKLAGVLDYLHGSEPERFDALNEELRRWYPEFDRVLLEPAVADGEKIFLLRTHTGQHKIQAVDLSHGTLFALAFLALAYSPNPPSIICFEEPEHGIHPRLLREVRDSMYRLCYPEEYGDKRSPVQVIATTHSPYMLDLYKDYPEEVVIAHKDKRGIQFERLSEKPHVNEFLTKSDPLGEVWYSGILGGVPSTP